MAKQGAQTRLVTAPNLRAWLLWLADHYDPRLATPENREIRRLGRTLEELGRLAGAIEITDTAHGTAAGERFDGGACLLSSFDWEQGEIEFCQPNLLANRLGSADPEGLITRLVAVTGIAERPAEVPPDPDYMV